MMMLPLADISFFWKFVAAVWVLIALSLILIVLLQKGRGGGIGAAFGGGGANSLLGTKTGDFLTWVTICLVVLFLVVGVLMGKFMRPRGFRDLAAPATATQMPLSPTDVEAEGEAPVGAPDADDAVEAVEAAADDLPDAPPVPDQD